MDMKNWGPLGPLAGNWQGDQGLDVSHSYSVGGTKENPYREEISFDSGNGGDMDGRRDRVVGRLPGVDVIVGMDQLGAES